MRKFLHLLHTRDGGGRGVNGEKLNGCGNPAFSSCAEREKKGERE